MLQKFEFMTTKYGPSVGDLVPLARLVMAVPEDGCVPPGSALNNAQQIAGNIAVFVRGVCMFPDKVSEHLLSPIPQIADMQLCKRSILLTLQVPAFCLFYFGMIKLGLPM